MDDSRRSAVPPKELSGRVCTVCSDRANGYNFGVLTCESCKAFFRRNAAKHHEIKCPFSNSCQITSASRKFCQACRLNKCFSVGMNSDWLADIRPKSFGKFKRKKPGVQMKEEVEEEDETEEKVSVSKALLDKLMQKAAEQPKQHCTCTCQCGFYPTTQRLTAYENKEVVPFHPPSDPRLPHPHGHSDSFSYSSSSATHSPISVISSTSSPRDSSNYSTPQLLPPSPSNYRASPAATAEAPSPRMGQYQQMLSPFQFAAMSGMGMTNFLSLPPLPDRTWTPNHLSPSGLANPVECEEIPLLTKIHDKIDKYIGVLNEKEMQWLEELHVQNEPLNAPLSKYYDPSGIDGVVRIIEEALRRIVNMACQLNTFRELHADDRKNLLKSGFCELLIVRGVMAFNKGDQSWNHSFGGAGKMEVKVDVLKTPQTREHYELHKRLLDTFGDDVRDNENLMLLFNAIVIFHPHVSNLRDSNKVHATQAKYFEILFKILRFEYDADRAEKAYNNLLNQVVDLHRVNHTMLRIFYGLDIAQLDPLIRELCSF